jgi:hypothetical protein
MNATLLREAIECIEGLVDQQAMPDDFYKPTLQRLKDALDRRESEVAHAAKLGAAIGLSYAVHSLPTYPPKAVKEIALRGLSDMVYNGLTQDVSFMPVFEAVLPFLQARLPGVDNTPLTLLQERLREGVLQILEELKGEQNKEGG